MATRNEVAQIGGRVAVSAEIALIGNGNHHILGKIPVLEDRVFGVVI